MQNYHFSLELMTKNGKLTQVDKIKENDIITNITTNQAYDINTMTQTIAFPIEDDVLIVTPQNNNTILHLACLWKRLDIAQTAIDNHIDIDTTNGRGSTALHMAACVNSTDIVMLLIRRGANVNIVNIDHNIPLHYAAYNGSMEMTEALLAHMDNAQIDVADATGYTALHFAVNANALCIVNLLVERKANMHAKNNRNQTPLDIALEMGYEQISNYLIDCICDNASNNTETISMPNNYETDVRNDNNRKTPLQLVKQVHVNNNYSDIYPIHAAAAQGDINAIQSYIKHNNSAINLEDNNGRTPLDIALENGYEQIANYLIDYTIGQATSSHQMQNSTTCTPKNAHDAIIRGNIAQIALFIAKKMNVNSIDDTNGNTILHTAIERNNKDIIKLIIRPLRKLDF